MPHHVDVPGTDRSDEVGSMAKSMLAFKEAALQQEALTEAKKLAEAAQQIMPDASASALS